MQLTLIHKGKEFEVLFDEEDLELLTKHTWRLKLSGTALYVSTPIYLGKINDKWKWKHVYLHRILLNAKKGQYVDHINGNPLDNRRSNLRICTNQQNTSNSKIRSNNKTGVKGVRYCKGKYIAQINIGGKSKYLGTFKTLEEGKLCYDNKAKEIHKEFRRI